MMKWWGWGNPDYEFRMDNKPHLWPWIAGTLKLENVRIVKPIAREQVRLAAPVQNEAFSRAVASFLKADQIRSDEDQRLAHAYGKSYPDLFLVRRGHVRRAPDLVLFPEKHADVEAIVREAHRHGVCLVPFGGGTNIVGGVNPAETPKMVVTLDMARMNRLLRLDPESNLAVIEAGALGPKLEKDLQEKGYSLGHFPDSFEFSSLGGWVATRSAGMQSDAYGKIEHMVVALKVVTPSGTIATRPVPASSAGPDLNQWMVGSEGVFGVITECTMRVHPAPKIKDYRGILFKSFKDGLAAIHESMLSFDHPNLIRLQDEWETELAFNMKVPKAGFIGFVERQFKKILKARGYSRPAIMIVGIEGDEAHVKRLRAITKKLWKKHGGFDLGTGVGATWAQDKYNLPYLRDYVMDRGCMVDVAETSTVWSNLIHLHGKVTEAMKSRFASEGRPGFIGCHLSHTYKTGACLYFTYACQQEPGRELEQYYGFKKFITGLFVQNGAALTHHHAVGTEHRPWMKEEISETGLQALKAVKKELDPQGLCNPGKLIPADDAFAGWVQPSIPHPAGREREAQTTAK